MAEVSVCSRDVIGVTDIGGVTIRYVDEPESQAGNIIAEELRHDRYAVDKIAFEPNDIVLDVGGHIGLFASYLGKKYPWIRIHLFEPFPSNWRWCRINLGLNGITNVRVHKIGVSGCGKRLDMATNLMNSGGATTYSRILSHKPERGLRSVTLDAIFHALNIERCRLLKIDTEGAEYEILYSSRQLSRVEYLRAEVHTNGLLARMNYYPLELLRYCRRHVDPSKCLFNVCKMSE